jgi:hypothetical protein
VIKWFGFWPHVTHVIVLTFKEIKHLSDYRTVGLSDYRSDPGFQVRGGAHLKKIASMGGRRENFWGISCE